MVEDVRNNGIKTVGSCRMYGVLLNDIIQYFTVILHICFV